jgi:hypothetical protein
MPKLIDYPRTTYASAWEVAEVTDDTGGKCTTETAARKLNRKVSGSFKAIIGSGVKFGLLTSKRDLLSTTTLFKRIKHAYDKQEELLFHREAFLTPPLFTQICRKFRSRELPVQMLDVMLIREFGVEEINAQGVAKAFVEGARMVGLLDEQNIVADIDQLASKTGPRRELANPLPSQNIFKPLAKELVNQEEPQVADTLASLPRETRTEPALLAADTSSNRHPTPTTQNNQGRPDAIASLFGLTEQPGQEEPEGYTTPDNPATEGKPLVQTTVPPASPPTARASIGLAAPSAPSGPIYHLQLNGPGMDTSLVITEEEDIDLVINLLEKIRRQLRAK